MAPEFVVPVLAETVSKRSGTVGID